MAFVFPLCNWFPWNQSRTCISNGISQLERSLLEALCGKHLQALSHARMKLWFLNAQVASHVQQKSDSNQDLVGPERLRDDQNCGRGQLAFTHSL